MVQATALHWLTDVQQVGCCMVTPLIQLLNNANCRCHAMHPKSASNNRQITWATSSFLPFRS